MKILYAAGESYDSKIFLERFIPNLSDKFILKIAAYSKFKPKFIPVDYNLDSCLSFREDSIAKDRSENLHIFMQQVKLFNPDLIISELENFTCYVAINLGIKYWVIGREVFHISLPKKMKLSYYSFSKKRTKMSKFNETMYYFNNAEKRLALSPFGDVLNFELDKEKNTSFVRPYYFTDKYSELCNHNVVCCLSNLDKANLKLLPNDSIVFSDEIENIQNLNVKSRFNVDDLGKYIVSCNNYAASSFTHLISDGLYNSKFINYFVDFSSNESIINHLFLKKFKLGTNLAINKISNNQILSNISLNKDIKYLHEILEEEIKEYKC